MRTLALNLIPTHIDLSASKRRGTGRWVVSALNVPALACTDDANTAHMAYICALDVLRKDHGLPSPPGFPVQSVLLAIRKRLDANSAQYDGPQRCTHCVAPLRRRRRPPKHGWMGCFSTGGKRCAACAANRRYHCFFPDPEVVHTHEAGVRPAFEEDVFRKREPSPQPVSQPEPVPAPELDAVDYATERRTQVQAEVAAALRSAKRQKTAPEKGTRKAAPPKTRQNKAPKQTSQTQSKTPNSSQRTGRSPAPQSTPTPPQRRPGARTRSQAGASSPAPAEPLTLIASQTPGPTSQAAEQSTQPRSPSLPVEMDSFAVDPFETHPFDMPDFFAPTDVLFPPDSTPQRSPPASGDRTRASVFLASALPTPPGAEPATGRSSASEPGPSNRATRNTRPSTSSRPSSSATRASSIRHSQPSQTRPPAESAAATLPTPPAVTVEPRDTSAPTPTWSTSSAPAPSKVTLGIVTHLYIAYRALYPALKTAIAFDDDYTSGMLREQIRLFSSAVEKTVAGGTPGAIKLPIAWDRVEREIEPVLKGTGSGGVGWLWLKDRLLEDVVQLGGLVREIVIVNELGEILVE